MWDLHIFADDDEGEMETLSCQSAGDVVQCCSELRWELFGIKERWARFEGRGNAGLRDSGSKSRHGGESQGIEEDDLWTFECPKQCHKFICDKERTGVGDSEVEVCGP